MIENQGGKVQVMLILLLMSFKEKVGSAELHLEQASKRINDNCKICIILPATLNEYFFDYVNLLGKNIKTLKEIAGTSIDYVRRVIYVLKLGEGRERRRDKNT